MVAVSAVQFPEVRKEGEGGSWACSGAISIGKLPKSISNGELSSVEWLK
jgi:hypothetical protein